MTGRKRSDIDDFFEWTTISYRTIKIIIGVFILLLLVGGWFLITSYIKSNKGKGENVKSIEKKAASFVSVEGKVMVKPLSSTEWIPANQVKEIFPGDLIRTGSNGRCKILFFNGTEYEVKPNSLISVLESYEELSTNKKIVGVELTNGKLNLTTSKGSEKKSKTKVETSNVVADVGSNTKATAEYSSREKKTSLRVSKGFAEIKSKITKKIVKITSHQGVEATDTGVKTFDFPVAPQLIFPENNHFFLTNRPQNLKITFEWRGDEKSKSYNFYLSKDISFSNIVAVKRGIENERIIVKGLKYGTYYWKVKPFNEKGVEGEASSTLMFAVKPERLNPAESIKIKYHIVLQNGMIEVVGNTTPDNKVKINGKEVFLDRNGNFNFFLPVKSDQKELNLVIRVQDYSGSVRVIKKKVILY